MSKYITNSNIYKMAQDFKTYVEKNGKIPYKLTYDGVEFLGCEMQDIMTYTVLNLKSNCRADTPKWCSNANGDTINEKIYKDDYLNQAQRVHDYILKNGQIPNFVTSVKSKKKVDIDLFSYCVSKILVFVKNNNQLPNYCLYNSKDIGGGGGSTIKKYGRSTATGCNNRGQNNGVYCGPHMAQEIIRNLTGIVIPQSTIASVMGTGSAGTSHAGIDTFFSWFNKNYGYKLSWTWKNFSDVGWDGINKILNSSNQDCGLHELYRDTWGHYTNYDKIYNNTVDVHNSLGSTCANGCYCGYTENRSKTDARRYLSGISQKSVIIVTNGGKA